MGDDYNETFDLATLLRFGDLDIRGVASNNRLLPAGEYFKLLSKFTNYAPHVADALAMVAAQGGDQDAFQYLAETKTLLDSIGCKKFTSALDEIIIGCKQGDKMFAAAGAKRITDDFKRFCARVQAAKRIQQPGTEDANNPAHENYSVSYGNHPLKKLLQIVDHEEATRKLRILAVDDAPVMLKIITSVLGDEYKVYGMSNPTMLEKFLKQITPDLFLLDYQMPELNGFELIPIIRSFEEHKTTPIIFLTSLGTIDHISAAVALGAVDFMVKPFQAEVLREKIAKHIVRKKLF
ncbi:MAG: response regulator [Treponema sp.]|nr:response regulator [Treponema sp.]